MRFTNIFQFALVSVVASLPQDPPPDTGPYCLCPALAPYSSLYDKCENVVPGFLWCTYGNRSGEISCFFKVSITFPVVLSLPRKSLYSTGIDTL